MPKTVVTGGAGFIGSHIVDALVSEKHEVTVLDDLSTGSLNNIDHLHGKIRFIRGDISRKELVDKAVDEADAIFHEAAMTSVAKSFLEPVRTWDVNIKGTKLLLNAAEKRGVKRFVFASSAAIYGADPRLPKTETMEGVPISPYGNSKSIAEMAVIGSHEKTMLKGVALRYFNVYGPRQSPDSDYSGVITKFISKMAKGERPTIYGDGEQTRDFVFVDDVVQANLLALRKNGAIGQVFNIGTGRQVSLNELVAVLNEILGTDMKPVYEPARQGDIRYSYADISKAEKLLGYAPKTNLKDGLKKTVEWFRQRQKNEK